VLQGDFHEPTRRAVTRATAAESVCCEDPHFRLLEDATTSGIPFWTCICISYFEFTEADCLPSGVLWTRMDVCNFCVVLRYMDLNEPPANFNIQFNIHNVGFKIFMK
jgi:hypothetical protein